MSDAPGPHDFVQGERGESPVVRAMSTQSRISNLLAIGLMSILGLGSLAWYYTHALMGQPAVRHGAAAANQTQGDVPLPALGRIAGPTPEPTAPLLAPTTLPEIPLAAEPPHPASGGPPQKTPAELALERILSGAVFSALTAGTTAPGTPAQGASAQAGSGAGLMPDAGAEAGGLAVRLHANAVPAVRAQMLPAQRLLLPKGAFIDCTLETAIDSTLPGMTTCVMATDTFGVDGKVVLLERGTKLVGETRGQVLQGTARIFVLWSEARSPTGVIVPLASPGADELGRAGLTGDVNRHFWERFGAAMLVSVIDGAALAAAQSSRNGNAVVINPSGGQDVVTEILKNTVNIPPTVVKRNGDRIQVLVARDLDFRSVYELRSAAAR